MGKEGKRLVLAAALSFAVLIAFQMFSPKAQKQTVPMAASAIKAEITPEARVAVPAAQKKAEEKKEVSAEPALTGEELLFDTPYAVVKFDTAGGKITGWVLKEYKENGKPVNLIWNNKLNTFPGTLEIPSLKFYDRVIYTAKKTETGAEFMVTVKNVVEVKKIYNFKKDNFACDITLFIKSLNKEVKKIADAKLFLGAGVNNHFIYDSDGIRIPEENLGAIKDKVVPFAHMHYLDEKLIKNTFTYDKRTNPDGTFEMFLKTGAKETDKGALSWIGVKDKYYLSAFLLKPEAGYKGFEHAVLYTPKVKLSAANELKGNKVYEVPYIMPLVALLLPEFDGEKGVEQSITLYEGPLVYENLKAFKAGLHRAMEMGWSWFSWLAIWMLVVLKWLFGICKNWGLAIILLTILVKVITWWPTQKSYIAMKKMQEVQPEITALRERFKDNPQKQTEETMKLYKEKKVNPLGGCLPMLLQIPIFVALYAVLANAIELRNASFLIWKDLSTKDPYFILIAIMIITMIIQQKMTPSTDPQQAKMMMWMMPIMFAIFFWSLPAGVILYWVVQNILGIAQQVMVNRGAPAA